MKLKFYTDPGHGWLAVKRKILVDWGLIDKITAYSYERGKTVYLEEDLDAGTFLKEAEKRGVKIETEEKYSGYSRIRNYFSFCP